MTEARSIRAAIQSGLSQDQVQVGLTGLDGITGKHTGRSVGIAGQFRATGNVTVAPPTAACSVSQGAAGNVNVGAHVWAYTNVGPGGVESSPGPVFAFSITGSAAHASLTAVARQARPERRPGRSIAR